LNSIEFLSVVHAVSGDDDRELKRTRAVRGFPEHFERERESRERLSVDSELFRWGQAKVIPGRIALSKNQVPLVDIGSAETSLPAEATDVLGMEETEGALGVVVASDGDARSAIGVGYFNDYRDPLTLLPGWFRFDSPLALGSGSPRVDVKPIEVFKSGDYDYLSTLLGHQGASSTFPCFWCNGSNTDFQRAPASLRSPLAARDLKMINLQLEGFEADTRKEAGKFHHNITQAAISPIEPSHTAPIILHIFLGQWCNLWDEFIRDIRVTLDGHTEETLACAACDRVMETREHTHTERERQRPHTQPRAERERRGILKFKKSDEEAREIVRDTHTHTRAHARAQRRATTANTSARARVPVVCALFDLD
jgi:hypothetical protein